jgi:hypothetical protein
VFIRSAIANPAASSFALFTLRPDERRCMVVAMEVCDVTAFLCAFSDITFVLMVIDMLLLQSRVDELNVSALGMQVRRRGGAIVGRARNGKAPMNGAFGG